MFDSKKGEWVSEWVNEWVSELVSEWVSEWLSLMAFWTVDIGVHVAHISSVILTYALESLLF